ncbi:ORF1 [Lishi Spider Virus 2]|uniref:ORF1 n=1 Tax=Lishi Spider Virus 2 TaxID=1608058 RepID=A0A0B5KEU4_9MONO|nr:ORF1 [Lishi Spider Virus 2]AJG39109.1 ORF1 [Lishi Spider Virus 2]
MSKFRNILIIFISMLSPGLFIERYHPIFFEKYGVLIEPNGVVTSYDKVKYVTLIYHFPGLQKAVTPSHCNRNASEQLYRNTLKHQIKIMYDLIPSSTHTIMSNYCSKHHALCLDLEKKDRPKRQIIAAIAALSGIAGLAISAYDWISSSELKNHLDKVSEHITKIDNKLIIQENLDYKLTKLSNDIIKKTSMSFENYHKFVKEYVCQSSQFNNFLSHHVATTHLEMELQALQRLINGEPDSYIINAETLESILSSDTEVERSIYSSDPSLFYQVVRSNLIHSDIEKSLFAFILEVPIIQETMISPLYKVYNGGWESKGILHKIDLPDSFYLYSSLDDVDYHAISLGKSNCWKRNEVVVCDNSKHMMTEDMICLNSILKREYYDSCDIKFSKFTRRKFVVKALSGVLVCGDLEVKIITSAGSQFHYIKNNKQENNYTKYYSYNEFKQIIVGNTIVSTNINKMPIVRRNDTISVNFDYDLKWADKILHERPWTSLKEINLLKDSGFEQYHGTISHNLNQWSVFLWVTIILCLIILIYLLIASRRKITSLEDRLKLTNGIIKLSNKRSIL